MSRADLAKSSCSLSRAVERVGDPWTLMILRESFLGTRRFEDFQRQTGASPHLLSQRLKQMCQDEILRKRLYCDHPQRFEYVLTEKGRDLWPMIMALRAWGDKWLGRPYSVRLTHKGCGAEMEPQLCCPDCGEPIGARDVAADIGPDLQFERNRLRT
ncbi:winged helix-turn-helix transcriptional regulator [Phaeobacter marinintestinus]|uniref:winged helix-turn-helix transcriptional regulator n=1 Tax=Falsiphaeobacter marinintestinus TaxID=1492905 RepID=UPI001C97E7AC|nr:helix-turn-helix domain-containing protein [Phaeobacter marinintestinus]